MHSVIWSWRFILSCPFACEGLRVGEQKEIGIQHWGGVRPSWPWQRPPSSASLGGTQRVSVPKLPMTSGGLMCLLSLSLTCCHLKERSTPPREAHWDFQTSSPLLKFCCSSSTYCKELSVGSFSFGQHLLDPWYMAGTNNLADQERHKPCLHTS